MNILSVVSSAGIAGDAMWIRISNIAKELETNGHKVDLFHYLIKITPVDETRLLDTIKRYENDYYVKSTKVGNIISIFYKYIHDLRSNKYDLIYGNTALGAFIPIVFKKISNRPVILDMHGLPLAESKLTGSNYLFNDFFCKLLESFTLSFSDKIFCVSNNMIQYLHENRKISMDKLVYVPNGVDFNFFKNPTQKQINFLKKELKIENKFVFGYIGGFQKWQGVEPYLEAIKLFKGTNVVFLIVGGDKKIIKDNIIFLPKVSRDKVTLCYSICNVLVLPRPKNIVTEVAAPTKFAEYAAMGIPILTTNVGDAAELVKKYKNGIVVTDNSPNNLLIGIKKFVEINSYDQNIIREMGQNSRKLAEKEFNWSIISKNIISTLTSLKR